MKCEPGCSCGRHRTMSQETKAKVVSANQKRKINATCSVDWCEKSVLAKGVCKAHYSKQWRNAVPKGLPFTVYQWEWDDPRIRSIIESQIDKKNAVRVGARKCKIVTVSGKDSKNFLNENHLQGFSQSSARYGLSYEGELLVLMTFGPPRMQKQNSPVEWELIRFCVKKGHLVPGGASRLLKFFVSQHNPDSIVSYSDNAKSHGNLYPILGFEFVNESAPGYVWWNGKEAKKRYECMTFKLRARYPTHPGINDMTERQIMESLGYQKIPNMGNKVFVWRKP